MGNGGTARYVLIACTNNATVAMSRHLFSDPARTSVASGRPGFQFAILPSAIDDFSGLLEEENAARQPTSEDRARRYIDTFLKEIYNLSQIGDTDTAGFKIFDFLDHLLLDGCYAVCDEILAVVDVEKLDTKLMRSFLSITAPAKKKLPARAALYKKIERKMVELRGEAKTRRIIGNLA